MSTKSLHEECYIASLVAASGEAECTALEAKVRNKSLFQKPQQGRALTHAPVHHVRVGALRARSANKHQSSLFNG